MRLLRWLFPRLLDFYCRGEHCHPAAKEECVRFQELPNARYWSRVEKSACGINPYGSYHHNFMGDQRKRTELATPDLRGTNSAD